MEGIQLNSLEQLKLDIVCRLINGTISKAESLQILDISERTLRRYVRAYKTKGVLFLKHGNYKRAPINKTSTQLKLNVQHLTKTKYFDFNISHLSEKIYEEIGIKIKYETLRKWCHEINIVKRSKKRRSRPRYYRPRMSQAGLLIQMDGSHHYWFGGRFLCLLAAIDDATNEVYARFYEGETSIACMDFLKRFIKRKGKFTALYTDRAGVYGGTKRTNFSQVERALGELGTKVIYAHSPEAKGRVERLFQTLQDRLVAELRLREISTLAEANQFLEKTYLPFMHNNRFTHLAENPITSYIPLQEGYDLDQIFSIKEYRKVGSDHTISIDGRKWMISKTFDYSIAKQRIELRYDQYGSWKAYYAGQPIKLVRIEELKKSAA